MPCVAADLVRAAELALSSDDDTFVCLVTEKSRQIEALQREAEAVRGDDALAPHAASLTGENLRDPEEEPAQHRAAPALLRSGGGFQLRDSGSVDGRAARLRREAPYRLTADMRSDASSTSSSRRVGCAGLLADPARPLRERIGRLEREKARAAELALSSADPGTWTYLVEERSEQIAALRAELEAVEADSALIETARQLTPGVLRELLCELGGPAAGLQAMVARVVLEPDLTCRVDYRSALGLSVACPTGFEPVLPP